MAMHFHTGGPATHPRCLSGWQNDLPVLTDGGVTLREVRPGDEGALLTTLNDHPPGAAIARPPATAEAYGRFIRWAQEERRRDRHASFAIVPAGGAAPVGVIQVWPVAPDFRVVEWGIVIGVRHQGTGLFLRSARLLAAYVFERLGTDRLEARVRPHNARARAALRKLGASPEMRPHELVRIDGMLVDHEAWSITADEWARGRSRSGQGAH